MVKNGWEGKNNAASSEIHYSQNKRALIIIILAIILLLASLSCLAGIGEVSNLSWDQKTATNVKATELALKSTVDFYVATQQRETYFPPTQTAYWSTQGPKLTQNSIIATQTWLPIEQTHIALSITEAHIDWLIHQEMIDRELSNSSQGEAAPSPPKIEEIQYPSLINADGKLHKGKLYFFDPDGDVVTYRVDIVSATGPGFEGTSRNIDEMLISGSSKSGTIEFGFYCWEKQDVTVSISLIDSEGNISDPKNLSFSCR